MRTLPAVLLLALALPAAAQSPAAALAGLDACLGDAAGDLAAAQTCYYDAAQVFFPNDGEYVAVEAQPLEVVRGGLDACLAQRSALGADLRQLCFYDAGNAVSPEPMEEDYDESEEETSPSGRVEIALYECLDGLEAAPAITRCYAEATAAYGRLTDALQAELTPFMSPAEAEAFRASEAAWQAFLQAETRSLDAAVAAASPAVAADVSMRRDDRLLNLRRDRYYFLDSLPRG